MTTPIPLRSGAWRVLRRCCTSGNCDTCKGHKTGSGSVVVVHGDHYTKEYAETVAGNWHAYDASAEPMPIEPVTPV